MTIHMFEQWVSFSCTAKRLQEEPKGQRGLGNYPLPVLEDSDEEDYPNTGEELAEQTKSPLTMLNDFDDEDRFYTDEQNTRKEDFMLPSMFRQLRGRQGRLADHHMFV